MQVSFFGSSPPASPRLASLSISRASSPSPLGSAADSPLHAAMPAPGTGLSGPSGTQSVTSAAVAALGAGAAGAGSRFAFQLTAPDAYQQHQQQQAQQHAQQLAAQPHQQGMFASGQFVFPAQYGQQLPPQFIPGYPSSYGGGGWQQPSQR